MNPSPIPTVTLTAPHPCKAHAGFATALSVDGIDCIVITKTTTDVKPLMDAIGFMPDIDMTRVMAVAVLRKDDIEVIP